MRVLLFLLVLGLAFPAQAADRKVIVIFGDSLTAGYGLDAQSDFTAQLREALTRKGLDADIRNAAVSGDTSAGWRGKLDWVLADDADLALVVLGGNDMLRGHDPDQTRKNLANLIAEIGKRDVPVLLGGMMAVRNMGTEYAERFDRIYPDLAEQFDFVTLYPFFLEGVAAQPELNQPDGIHPNAQGMSVIVENITPVIVDLLQ